MAGRKHPEISYSTRYLPGYTSPKPAAEIKEKSGIPGQQSFNRPRGRK